MAYILDRVFFTVLAVVMVLADYDINTTVIVGLIAVIVAAISYYLDGFVWKVCIAATYFAGCIWQPQLIYIAPLIMYELCEEKVYPAMFVLLGMNVYCFWGMDNVYSMCIISILEVASFFIYHKSERIDMMEQELKRVRDDSKEKNLLLAEKNRHIIEKKDSEIYVATLKERNRIARDIHDNVGHMLTRSILQMGALMTIYKDEPLHSQLESVKESLDVAMNNVRESVHDLHDESVDLRQSLEEMLEELKDRYDVRFDYDVTDGMGRKTKYAVIGIVKEAVSNIIKHSTNECVDVILREHPAIYQLVIHDYDRNLTQAVAQSQWQDSEGIGVRNMYDRVATLNGSMAINTSKGFKIFITLPKNGSEE